MKILVLGDGGAGKRHAGHLVKRGHEVQIAGPQESQYLEHEWDAYVIASPPEFHKAQLIFASIGNEHILCEGPCTHLPGPRPVAVNMMASNWRFMPQLQAFRKRLTNPILAHLWFDFDLVKWRPDKDVRSLCYYWSGHDLINVHEVDLAFWMFGPPERISIEKLHTGKSRACDGFQMLIRHQSGVLTTIASSWHSQHYRRGIYVIQKDGTTEEISFRTPTDDAAVNKSYEAMVDHWLDHIQRRDPLIEPSLEDGYRAYKALQGEVT